MRFPAVNPFIREFANGFANLGVAPTFAPFTQVSMTDPTHPSNASLSPSLQTALARFHQVYPGGGLAADLVTIHTEQFIVRATVDWGGRSLGAAMAMAPDLEQAEDRAKLRAIALVLAQHPRMPAEAGSPLSQQPAVPPGPWAVPQQGYAHATLSVNGSDASVAPVSQRPAATVPQPDIPLSQISPSPPSGPDMPPSSDWQASNDWQAPADWQAPDLPEADLTGSASQPTGSSTMTASSSFSPPIEEPIPSGQSSSGEALAEIDEQPSAEPTTPSKSASGSTRRPPKKTSRRSPASKSPQPETTEPPSPVPTPVPGADPNALGSPNMGLSIDLSDIIAKTSVELRRLGWTETQGREHLEKTYGKRSRQQLTDPELLDFLRYLEAQPTPQQSPF